MEPKREPTSTDVDDPNALSPRCANFGKYEGLAPAYLSPFAIETNVSRIAQQIAEGRTPTYD